jgi:hypothetical protein
MPAKTAADRNSTSCSSPPGTSLTDLARHRPSGAVRLLVEVALERARRQLDSDEQQATVRQAQRAASGTGPCGPTR